MESLTTGKMVMDEVKRCALAAKDKFMAIDFVALDASQKKCMQTVTYIPGHPLEVVTVLQKMSESPTKKYQKFPMFALFLDLPIHLHKYGDYHGTTLSLLVACATKQNYTSAERELYTFNPFLRPLYKYLMAEIIQSNVFQVQYEGEDVKGTVWERFFWGKGGLYGVEGNVFNDLVDAIQIENLELKILSSQC